MGYFNRWLRKHQPDNPEHEQQLHGNWADGGATSAEGRRQISTRRRERINFAGMSGMERARLTAEFIRTNPKTIDEHYAVAEMNQRELVEVLNRVAKTSGIQVINNGIKTRESAEGKLDRGGIKRSAEQLKDIVRASAGVQTTQEADVVVEALANHFDIIDEHYAVSKEGYADRKVLVRFSNGGQIGEVQISTPLLFERKYKGDPARGIPAGESLYHKIRNMTPEQKEGLEGRRLSMLSNQLYSDAVANSDPSWQELIRAAMKMAA